MEINNQDSIIRSEVVAGHTGEIPFYVDQSAGSESHTIASRKGFKKKVKECVSLSDFICDENLENVYVKIDAEGGENEILSDILSLDINHLEGLVEFHPDKFNRDLDLVLESFDKETDACEFITDSSPNHPNSDSIDNDSNRPIYYFKSTRTVQ